MGIALHGIEEKAVMFKVATITDQMQRILVLEGGLAGPGLSDLKGRWG
jgi:hypothetical protein